MFMPLILKKILCKLSPWARNVYIVTRGPNGGSSLETSVYILPVSESEASWAKHLLWPQISSHSHSSLSAQATISSAETVMLPAIPEK